MGKLRRYSRQAVIPLTPAWRFGNLERMKARGKHTWRRYQRVSLTRVAVLVLVIGGCLGWISYNASVQRDVVTALKDAGHTWAFRLERNDGNPNPSGKPWAPIWLLERIGHHYFGRVTYVQFWIPLDGSGADEDLPLIPHLSSLEELDLQGARVSGRGTGQPRRDTLLTTSRILDAATLLTRGWHLRGRHVSPTQSRRKWRSANTGGWHISKGY